jgi:AhpD family alkylhydroperoxidase
MATTDFNQYRTELRDGYRRLAAAIPETMQGFEGLHRAAVADGALPRATKELMALAIGIAARCDGCITLHAHAALRAGATADEAREAVGVAVLMGGRPASVYAIEALDAIDQFASSLV